MFGVLLCGVGLVYVFEDRGLEGLSLLFKLESQRRMFKKKLRSNKLRQDTIDTIHAAARRHCPTSPCMNYECRPRRLNVGHCESARALFRHDTWNEYWAWLYEDSPATAAKIVSTECLEEASQGFRGRSLLCHRVFVNQCHVGPRGWCHWR